MSWWWTSEGCSSLSGFIKSHVVMIDAEKGILTLAVGKYRPHFDRAASPYWKLCRIRIIFRILFEGDEILAVTTFISDKITPRL